MTGSIRLRVVGMAASTLVIGGLACSFGLGGGVSTPPGSPIPVSTEAAGQFLYIWATAVAGATDGQVSVTMTEQQLTSYLALKLLENPDSPIHDPQIFLRDGKMIIHASATTSGITSPVQITMSAEPDAEGQLQVDIEQASLGPLPMPEALRDSISKTLNELIAGDFGPKGTGVKITAVTIADGQMVMTGSITR